MEIDEGMFRVGVRGFNKADVLAYIDSLNTAHTSDLQNFQKLYTELQQSFGSLQKVCAKLKSEFDARGETIAELEKKAASADEATASLEVEKAALRSMAESGKDARDSYARLKARMDELQAENESLSKRLSVLGDPDNSEELDHLLALHTEYERRISELEQQLDDARAVAKTQAENESVYTQNKVQLEIVKQQLASAIFRAEAAEKRLVEDEHQRQKYQDFVGSIGAFMAELHSASHGIMQSTFRRSDECLRTIESTISSMRAELEEEIVRQNNASGERLNEIAYDLSGEESGAVPPAASPFNYNPGFNGKNNG